MSSLLAAQQQPQHLAPIACQLGDLDGMFEPMGCIGQGNFGNVYLARKKSSGRTVALKVAALGSLDVDHEDPLDAVQREVQAVRRLNQQTTTATADGQYRDLSIVFFEEWYLQAGSFACIVMKHVPCGTLAQELERTTAYTERRLAWYCLQLAEALQFAHERGVAHHDVKSTNCLLDRGGKLLLADFGSAVAPGEDSVGFTKNYASPELLDAYARDDFAGLEADKIDAFGLGCILYELLSCKRLDDLGTDQTLGGFIQERGVEAALDLPVVKLPWLPATPSEENIVGYSVALRNMVLTLLEPNPQNRFTPSHLPKPLRTDPGSPLLRDLVVAAHPPKPGAAVTVDNIQLGMFVQRGQDWDDDAADGGKGRIGVVVRLDPDASYTEVAWSHFQSPQKSEESNHVCYRIGAGDKFELQVGPTPVPDFFTGTNKTMVNGLVPYSGGDISKQYPGQMWNENCIIVGVNHDQKYLLMAPLQSVNVPTIQQAKSFRPPIHAPVMPRQSRPPPDTWQLDGDLLIEVGDTPERTEILEAFYANQGGLDIQEFELISIKRVESTDLWSKFADASEAIAAENWGVSNQRRLFIGPRKICPENLLQSGLEDFFGNLFSSVNDICLYQNAKMAKNDAYQYSSGIRALVLSRVALGRVKDLDAQRRGLSVAFHSMHSSLEGRHLEGRHGWYSIQKTVQAYPEYIIYFKPIPGPSPEGRRVVRAARPSGMTTHGRRATATATVFGESAAALYALLRPAEIGSPARPAASNSSPSTPPVGTTGAQRGDGGSATKRCVVCLSNPVKRILVPCGHPCLCQLCSTAQGLEKLRRKCPECRANIREVMTIYGRVVED